MNQKVKSILIILFLGFNILLFTSFIAFKQLKALVYKNWSYINFCKVLSI